MGISQTGSLSNGMSTEVYLRLLYIQANILQCFEWPSYIHCSQATNAKEFYEEKAHIGLGLDKLERL